MSSNKHKEAISLMGFVPALVVQYYASNIKNKNQIKALPAKQGFKSVVMFADISGFTNLTETLSKLGSEGAEMTAFVINRYMELLIKAISKSGGDIFKFAGDAMIVVWPPSVKDDPIEQHEELRTYCRMALQTALDIQAKLGDTCILENIKLSVKIGFGVGDINIIYVGGVFDRSEYLATGDPLIQAFSSEHCASKGGETIVSQEVFNLVKDFFKFQAVEGHEAKKFYFVKTMLSEFKLKLKAEAQLIKNTITLSQFQEIKQYIMQYIPAALLPYIEINQENWSSELRYITTLFINLGIDLSDARTDTGLQRIQRVIKTVQKCVYKNEGSLNKLLMDDKGSTLIVVFGLPPLSHQNDAVRAIQTAFLMEEELKKINCKCKIGIATGTAFCGVVGTSGSRREYSVLGDCINLSARLMQMAMKPLEPAILIDEQTAQDAQQKIHSMYHGDRYVKGKEFPISVYDPLAVVCDFKRIQDIRMHFQNKAKKIMEPSQTIIQQEHSNSVSLTQSIMNIGRKAVQTLTNMTKKDTKIFSQQSTIDYDQNQEVRQTRKTLTNPNKLLVGYEKQIKDSVYFMNEFLQEYNKSDNDVQNRVLIIRGAYGIGKSFFMKNVFADLMKQNRQSYKYGEKMDVMISTLNPNSKTLHLNSARIILRNIFLSISQRFNKHGEDMLKEITQNLFDDKSYNFLCNVLSIFQSEFEFPETNREEILDYTRQETQKLNSFIDKIFGLYLEKNAKENNEEEQKENVQKISPLIMMIDDMQDTDEISFYVFRYLLEKFKNICFIGLIRDQSIEKSVFESKTKLPQEDVWKSGLLALNTLQNVQKMTVTLKGLSISTNENALQILIEKYYGFTEFYFQKKQVHQEQQEQTIFTRYRAKSQRQQQVELEQPEYLSKLKDKLLFWESRYELINQDYSAFCYNFIYLKTGGQPLMVINLINNLINQRFLVVDQNEGKAIVTEQLNQIFEHDEMLTLDVPLIQLQINGPQIDQLTCQQQLILKCASVIGDIFDVQTLYCVIPFKGENRKKLLNTINILMKSNVIEFIDGDEENTHYRFVNPFFREVLYQRMVYSQRRQLHRNVAIAFQKIPQPFDYNEKKEYLKLKYHWHLAQGRQAEHILSIPEKKQIVIKKIKRALDRNPHDRRIQLKIGYLLKRSEKGVFWDYRYCVLDSESFRIYQLNDKNQEVYDESIVLPLKSLQQIVGKYNVGTFTQSERHHALIISTSSWTKRSMVIEESRKFYFAIETEEELEEWLTFLEFAKSYAIYQEFVMNFGKISFPITFSDYDFGIQTELDQQNRKAVKIGVIEQGSSNNQNRVSRQTRMQKSTIVMRKSTSSEIIMNSLFSTTNSSQQQLVQQREQEALNKRIKLFIMKGQIVLYSHLIIGLHENFTLQDYEQIQLGDNNKFLSTFPEFLQCDYD